MHNTNNSKSSTIDPRWTRFTFRDTIPIYQQSSMNDDNGQSYPVPPPPSPPPPPPLYKKKDGIFPEYTPSSHPIVIDNGSYTCKVGWAGDNDPTLVFAPLVGRQRGGLGARKNVIGNDLQPEDFSRLNVRSPFDRDVVINLELQERILDYIFSKMNIDTDRINHPVLMTECVANPVESRTNVTELLFECYRVPAVCYGVDALFSYHHYRQNAMASGVDSSVLDTGLVVRSGFHATHVLPVVNGRFDPEQCIRLSIGGYELTDFTMHMMQLKYPHHSQHVTLDKAEQFKEEHTYVSLNYDEELERLATDEDYFHRQTHVAELPYETSFVHVPEKTEEELRREAEKRKAFAERMRKLAAERKVEQRLEKEQQLRDLLELKELQESDPKLYDKYRKEYGYENDEEVDETIKFLKRTLRDAAKRDEKNAAAADATTPSSPVAEEGGEDKETIEKSAAVSEMETDEAVQDEQAVTAAAADSSKSESKEPATPADETQKHTPAQQQNQQQQERSKQKKQNENTKASAVKGGGKEDKKTEEEKKDPAVAALLDEKLKEERPEKYLKRLRNERINLMRRISVVKQMRAKAEDSTSRSRRRTGASNRRLKAMAQALDDENDDTFGMEDEDWELYASINEAGVQAEMDLDSMKEMEARDEKLLRRIDETIIAMEQELYGSATLVPHQRAPTHYLDQFKFSLTNSPTIGTFKDQQEESQYYQMRFTVERIRVPEVIFQPSIIGIETAGLAELLDIVLRRYSHDRSLQSALARNVYICGGNTMFPQFTDRVLNELRMLRPVGSNINVAYQHDPLDAWRGASAFAMDEPQFSSSCITRKQYEEAGPGYMKEHAYSNRSLYRWLK